MLYAAGELLCASVCERLCVCVFGGGRLTIRSRLVAVFFLSLSLWSLSVWKGLPTIETRFLLVWIREAEAVWVTGRPVQWDAVIFGQWKPTVRVWRVRTGGCSVCPSVLSSTHVVPAQVEGHTLGSAQVSRFPKKHTWCHQVTMTPFISMFGKVSSVEMWKCCFTIILNRLITFHSYRGFVKMSCKCSKVTDTSCSNLVRFIWTKYILSIPIINSVFIICRRSTTRYIECGWGFQSRDQISVIRNLATVDLSIY